MSQKNRLYAALPALMLLAYCAYSFCGDLEKTAERAGQPRGDTPVIEALFSDLKPWLGGAGEVGFVYRGDPNDRVRSGATYFIAQYALAPVRLLQSVEYPLVVGYFLSPQHLKTFVAENPMAVVEDFYNGVVLLRPEGDEQ